VARGRIEATLDALGALRRAPVTDASQRALRAGLAARSSHVVARAAQVIGELALRPLAADVATAFDRFLVDPVKTDPGCRAKIEIARALHDLGDDPRGVFLRGIRHVQLEPVYGGREDSAPELRALCAVGLVRIGHPSAVLEAAELLADRAPAARIGAARALAYSGDAASEPLLRLKALVGDDDPAVLSECLDALLALAPGRGLPFVARFLDAADPAVQEAAALALGGSRRREALPLLRGWWERSVPVDLRRTGLLAIAMLRHDEALDLLVGLVGTATGPDARDAIAALATFRHDDALRARVAAAIAARTDVDLRAAFDRAF
jgi:HEAT repeat protein